MTIIRWVSCNSDKLAEDVLIDIPSDLPVLEGPKNVEVNGCELLIFDSANNFAGRKSFDLIKTKPGHFKITTEIYKEKNRFEFIVHRFLPFVI